MPKYRSPEMAEQTNNRRTAWFIGGAVLLLLVTVLILLAGRGQPPEIQVVQVAREDLEASIASNGKVEPIAPFVFRALFPTFVTAVHAKEGEAVKKGQLIVTLSSSDIQSQLIASRSDLLTAQAELRNAQAGGPPDEVAQLDGDLQKAESQVANLEQAQKRLQQLFAKQAATQADIDKNALDLASARASLKTFQQKKDDLAHRASLDIQRDSLRVQQDTEQIHSLEEKLRSATVVAPVDGTLYSLPVRLRDYLAVGQEIAQIADLHKVQVRAFVDEPDIGSLAPGQDVRITWDAMPSREWNGQTEQIPKEVVPHGARSVGEVPCSVDNSRLELLPNVNVSLKIFVRREAHALAVSRAAVRTDGTRRYVFVFGDGRVRRRDVSVGIASAAKYQVLSGLSEGDHVAIPGDVPLADGMTVRATEAK